MRKKKQPLASMLAIECDGRPELFIVFNGVRIAKRGHPNTPQAKTWIALEPGFTVLDNDDLSRIIIEKNEVAQH